MERRVKDLGLEEVTRRARFWREQGFDIYFKFTCKYCGSRQTFEEPNKVFTSGKCEERGKVTKLDKWGFLMMSR